jgi:hypothetical protein
VTTTEPTPFSSLSWNLLPTARHMSEVFHAPLRLLHVDTVAAWRDRSHRKNDDSNPGQLLPR